MNVLAPAAQFVTSSIPACARLPPLAGALGEPLITASDWNCHEPAFTKALKSVATVTRYAPEPAGPPVGIGICLTSSPVPSMYSQFAEFAGDATFPDTSDRYGRGSPSPVS